MPGELSGKCGSVDWLVQGWDGRYSINLWGGVVDRVLGGTSMQERSALIAACRAANKAELDARTVRWEVRFGGETHKYADEWQAREHMRCIGVAGFRGATLHRIMRKGGR